MQLGNGGATPSPADQRKQIRAIQSSGSLVEGETWYLCHAEWWKKWMTYTGYTTFDAGTPTSAEAETPGPIVNAPILMEGMTLAILKPKMVRTVCCEVSMC